MLLRLFQCLASWTAVVPMRNRGHTMSAAARVFESHSVSCVESLTFISEGIIWH